MKRLFITLLLFSFGLKASPKPVGVRALSLGGAYRALSDSTNSMFYNPAGILKNRETAVGLDYLFGSSNGDHKLSLALADSSTTSWALGLAYLTDIGSKSKKPINHNFILDIAFPLVENILLLGGNITYQYQPDFMDENHSHFFNFDLGVLVTSPLGLSFAIVAENIIPPKGLEPAMALSLGSAFEINKILPIVPIKLSLDLLLKNLNGKEKIYSGFAAGIQYNVLPMLPFRLGFSKNTDKKNYYLSLGAGISLVVVDIDFLYLQNLEVGKNRNFGASINLHF